LHGSPQAKAEGDVAIQQHSKLVGRGKYVHEFQTHKVHPGRAEEYKRLIGEYYTAMNENPDYECRLTGSWEVTVGDLDTFIHVWEYEGFKGFDVTKHRVLASKGHKEVFQSKIMPLIVHRKSQLNQEFAFWASSPPHNFGGIYEMRSYHLRPGTLLEWETEWRRGLEARRHYVQPVGAWFAQVGRLHEVHHLWQYPDMETRKAKREEAWKIDTWSKTVAKTVKLAYQMNANILQPLPFSPLR